MIPATFARARMQGRLVGFCKCCGKTTPSGWGFSFGMPIRAVRLHDMASVCDWQPIQSGMQRRRMKPAHPGPDPDIPRHPSTYSTFPLETLA